MRNEDIWEYFLREYRTRHIADENVMRAILCVVACTQIRHSFGLHPKISGEKGTGKSSAVNEAIRLVAPQFVLRSSFSAKALFYSAIQRGTIIISDDSKPDEITVEIIKRKISEYHEKTRHTVILDKKKQAVTLEMPEETTFILTSVTDSADDQLIDRQWILSVNKDSELDRRYANFLLKSAETGFQNIKNTHETAVCRTITTIIRQYRYEVVIPFATKIDFTESARINRRSLNTFIDIICCSAVINQFKRVREEIGAGEYRITATHEDVVFALTLMGFGSHEWRYKLSKPEVAIYTLIIENPGGISQNEIAKRLKLSMGRVSQILHGEGKTSCGLSTKAPIYMHEEYNKETGVRSHIWQPTDKINMMESFANLAD